MKTLKVVLFISRNKDNEGVEGFKKRSESFLSTKSVEELSEEFNLFVAKGVAEEVSRFYHHVNARDNDKIRKALLHHLIDHENINMASLPQKVASIASKAENRAESKWLFDFDDDNHLINDFVNDIRKEVPSHVAVIPQQTPNGHAVVVGQGFDTRELLAKWDKVELKRDDMLCVDWKKKEGGQDGK